jgi:peptidoglycan/xylan/chitin deacetylase (PgdA/CDA1 family)
MKPALKIAVLKLATLGGVNALLRQLLLQSRFLVLCYHGVLARSPANKASYNTNVLQSEFEDQIRFLAANFNILSASDLIAIVEDGHRLPRRSAIVTFDDGFLNNLMVAAPILRNYRVPAIFNLSTDYIGGNQVLWPDEVFLRVLGWKGKVFPLPDGRTGMFEGTDPNERSRIATQLEEKCKLLENDTRATYLEMLRAGSSLPDNAHEAEAYRFLTWDDVRELSRQGFEIGSHTASHPILSRVGNEQLENELATSKARIEKEIGKKCRVIAYPNGLLRDAGRIVWDAAAAVGYKIGFMLRRGLATPRSPMAINRINVPGNQPPEVFDARAGGTYLMRRWDS